MRPIHPIAALIGIVIGVLLAVVIAPLFPAPLSTIVYWVGWVGALIALLLGLWYFIPRAGTGPRV